MPIQKIEFDENTILRLHEIMMSYSGYEYGGKYKTDNNLIIEQDEEENRKIRFKPILAEDVLGKMVRNKQIQIIGKGRNSKYMKI